MRIFASWSGELSHGIAALVKTWLEDVLQGCTVWLSSENIEKGSVWFSDVSDTLKDTTFGILCVSRQCATAPWLLFEAGALSKGLTSSRVSPLLIDITTNELKPPLSLLNATLPTEQDIFKLVKSINNHSGDSHLAEDRLDRAFRRCWPEFFKGFEACLKGATATKPAVKRTDRELLEEVVDTAKSVYRAIQDSRIVSVEADSKRLEIAEMQRLRLESEIALLTDERAKVQDLIGSNLSNDREPLMRQVARYLLERESPRKGLEERILKGPPPKKG